MKYIGKFLLLLLFAGCSAGPHFNAARDREEGNDIICHFNGQYVTGYHQCRAVPEACCPDGTSCSKDDFVPSAAPNACRPWYGQDFYP